MTRAQFVASIVAIPFIGKFFKAIPDDFECTMSSSTDVIRIAKKGSVTYVSETVNHGKIKTGEFPCDETFQEVFNFYKQELIRRDQDIYKHGTVRKRVTPNGEYGLSGGMSTLEHLDARLQVREYKPRKYKG